MEEFLIISPWISMILQLLLAASLGALLGIERSCVGKDAGTRTFALISLGSSLFTIISLNAFQMIKIVNGVNFDPSRIASQIVTGIGFIGMAVIFRRGKDLEGVTTAVSIWVAAAIGMAIGAKFYILAIGATIITLFIQGAMRMFNLEERLRLWHKQREKNDKRH